jgi:hypothetical protein
MPSALVDTVGKGSVRLCSRNGMGHASPRTIGGEAGGVRWISHSAIAEFFENFLGETVNGPLRVVEARAHAGRRATPSWL